MANANPAILQGGHVLAAIDHSSYGDAVCGYAAWAASRLGAPLEFLHVFDPHERRQALDLSGSLGADEHDFLLAGLATADEARAKRAQEAGRALLHRAAELAAAAGLSGAGTRMRSGDLAESLVDLQGDVRLYVIGKRGSHADQGETGLGGGIERVLRAVHRPVLVVPRVHGPVRRILIAFDGSATMRRGVELVAASPLLRGLDLHVVMAGAGEQADRDLEWAGQALLLSGGPATLALVGGSPAQAIESYVREHHIDLLVMGAYGHSRIRELLLGSTTNAMLASSLVPVLLLR